MHCQFQFGAQCPQGVQRWSYEFAFTTPLPNHAGWCSLIRVDNRLVVRPTITSSTGAVELVDTHRSCRTRQSIF